MQDKESSTVVALEEQITGRYGLLLSQTQLAELLGRTPGGLRYSLSYPSDHHTRALAPPAETGVVLNQIDLGKQPARYTLRVHWIVACAGFLPHMRSRTAHADMSMWLSFMEGTPGRSHQG